MSSHVRFLQIHWLASYPAALVNRDEAGLAKRLPFGGETRARISSQCLKRHWRLAGQDSIEQAGNHRWSLQRIGIPMGARSKDIVNKAILPRATEGLNVDVALLETVRAELHKRLYGDKAEDSKKRQALFFGEPEIDYLAAKTREALASDNPKAVSAALETFFKSERANLKEMAHGAGLESALFGRMVTSDPAANRDAAVHVAHALSVHAMERELDFMTVVDDLKAADADAGAAGVFDMELASGLYYGYVVIDVELLVSNLAGDREMAAKVVEHLVHLIAEVSPGAKKGSTAPYSYAEFMLVEAGERQPRTLANAFRKAIPLRGEDVGVRTVRALDQYLQRLDTAYGQGEERRQLSVLDAALDDTPTAPLDDLGHFAAKAVVGGAP